MKFLMDYTGEVAVNTAFVKALNIETFSENEVFLFASVDDYEYEDPNTGDTYLGAIVLKNFIRMTTTKILRRQKNILRNSSTN